ncbi:MAG: 50S ribosomal protein L30 [Deltaproteobacteria bacterium RIFOXYA12_FULL_58_15]|nr:MAG: 50S ribosomal protein L30 [Deltaproteobacteria bacterium RIFOXYA12_FULL_58_15]OGR15329.1 MAG: 50S ribosomal protein L30 [Deltaproteobacteria bacterium RIFOXYB12_FULL_58_9]
MTQHFEVTLKRSGVGRMATQRRTLVGLGLSKFGRTVYLQDTPEIRGMLYKVVHLVDVTPHDGTPPPSRRQRERAQAKS